LRGIFDLDGRQKRVIELEEKTTQPNFWNDNQAAQGLLKEVSLHKRWLESHSKLISELNDLKEISDMVEEGSSDALELEHSITKLVEDVDAFEFKTLLSGPDDHRDAIVTIHPGAGGTESQDWAEMLFRMYGRWVERKGYTSELIDYQPGEEAGLKSVTLEVKGEYVYGFLKAESGVHRLVRISPFDANARRHTSFVSVHVYPVIEDAVDIEIKDEDIRIDTYRSSGAGDPHHSPCQRDRGYLPDRTQST
jgi:peptide chain release factor 2